MNGSENEKCCHGPGYASPKDAFLNGPRERLLYVPCIVPDKSRPDYLATIDADPDSPTYSAVIHRLPLAVGDEPHHSGWNACSSCYSDACRTRSLLILPTLGSNRVYSIDTATDPRAPRLSKTVENADIASNTGLAYLHTSHCLGSGDIMISAMGDLSGNSRGNFLILGPDMKIKGTWADEDTPFGYDFWYQPRLNVMISTAWGAPSSFTKGFNPDEVAAGKYGSSLYIWDWNRHEMIQEIDLGQEGLIPLEVRFLHEPSAPHAYVGAALSSNVIHVGLKTMDGHTEAVQGTKLPGIWEAGVAIKQPWVKVEGWVLPEMPPLITDILVSMDDRFLYFSNWLRGDVCQYDISDPTNPRFVSRLFLGGAARRGGPVKVLGGLPEDVGDEMPEVARVNGKELAGGPQMIQLSLDGRRLYVTNSLYSPWDKQFYPDMVKQGGYLLKVDVDTERGGMKLDPGFYVDFGAEPGGPALAHEVRYPGGDCSSDIWL